MQRLLRVLGLFLLVHCLSVSGKAQDEDDVQRYLPGLLARYKTGPAAIERIDDGVALVRDDEKPPVAGLSAGAFTATWSGGLFVRQPDAYSFHAFLQGVVELSIDGKPLLSGTREQAGWVSSEPIDLDYGEHDLEARFRSEAAASRIQLFWSTPSIGREPIPADALFRTHDDAAVAFRERGAILFDALRCNRCHQSASVPQSDPAPALTHLEGGLSEDWIVDWLCHPERRPATSLMPDYGFNEDEARTIAAFLLAGSARADELPMPPEGDNAEKNRRAGEVLFRTVGCLACHERHGLGHAGLFGGGDLSAVAAKRSRAWLERWLAAPEPLNPDHRMPVFELSDQERRQLAVYLGVRGQEAEGGERASGRVSERAGSRHGGTLNSQLSTLNSSKTRNPKPQTPVAEVARLRGSRNSGESRYQRLVDRGRELVTAGRCAACHRIPEIDTPPPVAGSLDASQHDWSKSCLDGTPDKEKGRPVFRNVDRDAIVRYVEGHPGGTSPPARFALGRLVLRRNNCLGCHPRGLELGIVATAGEVAKLQPELEGESQVLIPPPLTAVGDKLHDAALKQAVLGEQPKRLPWLRVRMPKFPLTDLERDDLVYYLIAHDRIPDSASKRVGERASGQARRVGSAHQPAVTSDAADSARAANSSPDGDRLIAGHELIGGKGFSCVSCHAIGSFMPAGVALGTRGSNLRGLAGRMRREYFLRWTRSPLRIVAGVEMPSFDRPVPGLLDGDLERQLDAVWDALNDPNFTAPTNPDVVEQYLVVASGEPARVVRDVFTMPPPPAKVGEGPSTHDGRRAETGPMGRKRSAKSQAARFVPRSFAVGLNNGHNLLFDLDAFAVRSWWFGDFARQRTQGKTWLWDTAGVPLAGDTSVPAGFVAVDRRGEEDRLLIPPREHATIGRLLSYTSQSDGVRLRYHLNLPGGNALTLTETFTPLTAGEQTGWRRDVLAEGVPAGVDVYVLSPNRLASTGDARVEPDDGAAPWNDELLDGVPEFAGRRASRLKPDPTRRSAAGALRYVANLHPERLTPVALEPSVAEPAEIMSVPGYKGVRLPLPTSIMPTALTWLPDSTLAFCSLKGHVYLAHDTDGDGLEDKLTLFEEGLAAPYGILAEGDWLLVSHKPEVLRLLDTDGDGRADRREVVATGWGYNDNYHDWTMALSRDSKGRLYVGLGSDYAQPGRPRETTRWRGKLLRIDPAGNITPVAHALRYPTGIAIDAKDRVFISDNQGVGNTFNEINHLVEGHHYGVPSLYEEPTTDEPDWPAIQIPHPWTRSVNGLFFLPDDERFGPFAGHGIGCELNNRFLVRFTYEEVDGVVQGAVYPFSAPLEEGTGDVGGGQTFLGPIAGAVGPSGDLYIASLFDSGWMGGRNQGEIVRLHRQGEFPLGIREIRALPSGFVIEFTAPVDPERAADAKNYTLSGYTRHWQGSYETPDSDRHRVEVRSVRVSADGRGVELRVDRLRPKFVYDIACGNLGPDPDVPLWPAIGHYTMRRVPTSGHR